mmetsp:Transcript_5145/g.22188  ORF Transcript_5145/g.22188 Transcript_5145/m.22188 type:complete len:130 (+) Transcript_5145:346-735(+)
MTTLSGQKQNRIGFEDHVDAPWPKDCFYDHAEPLVDLTAPPPFFASFFGNRTRIRVCPVLKAIRLVRSSSSLSEKKRGGQFTCMSTWNRMAPAVLKEQGYSSVVGRWQTMNVPPLGLTSFLDSSRSFRE